MTLTLRDIGPLWWAFIVRYCLYTSGVYLLMKGVNDVLPMVDIRDLLTQHRGIAISMQGAWGAAASVIALKQAINSHIASVVAHYNAGQFTKADKIGHSPGTYNILNPSASDQTGTPKDVN